MNDMKSCVPKQLPAHLLDEAVRIAREVNPANGVRGAFGLTAEKIAVLTSRYWGAKGVDLGVTFLDTADTALKAKILSYANKWGKFGNVRFRESTSGEVRLARDSSGYWSFLGTDILSIPKGQATLNLQAFSLSTPDSEFDRVVCHEFGHTLGFPHEHERKEVLALLDVEKTVAWFAANVGWDRQTVMEQVFDPLDPADLRATAADVRSIMCYQFAGACTKSGQPIPGGLVIDETDGLLVSKIYPSSEPPPPPPPPTPSALLKNIGLSLAFDGWTNGAHVGSVAQVKGTAKVNAVADPPLPAGLAGLHIPPVIKLLLREYAQIVLPILLTDLAAGKKWADIVRDVIAAILANDPTPDARAVAQDFYFGDLDHE